MAMPVGLGIRVTPDQIALLLRYGRAGRLQRTC